MGEFGSDTVQQQYQDNIRGERGFRGAWVGGGRGFLWAKIDIWEKWVCEGKIHCWSQ